VTIGGHELEHVEEIEEARMLCFIKRISREFNDNYTDKALFVPLVRPNLEFTACVWSHHQVCQSERVERIQQDSQPTASI
jgi:hypothetical protein